MVTVKQLYENARSGDWRTAGLDVQYRIERGSNHVIVAFQGTAGALSLKHLSMDWRLNLSAWVAPYRDMPERWYAHAGFLKGYKSVRDLLMGEVAKDRAIYLTGYSIGAAYATLMHEDIVFNRPDARVRTVTFGGPRVVWGSRRVLEGRFQELLRIVHRRDPVPMLPFALLGWRHVGELGLFGEAGLPSCKAHTRYRMAPWMSYIVRGRV